MRTLAGLRFTPQYVWAAALLFSNPPLMYLSSITSTSNRASTAPGGLNWLGIKKPNTWLGFLDRSSGYCLSLRRPKSPSRPPSVSKPNRGSVGTAVAGVPEELDELPVPQVADEITRLDKTVEI